MRRSLQSPPMESGTRRSARISLQHVASNQGQSSTSHQKDQGPKYTSTPRPSRVRNSQQNGTKFEGQTSMSQRVGKPQYTSTPRRSLRSSQQNGTNLEGQSSMSQQPAENSEEINPRKNSTVSPRILELIKELEETRKLRKYNAERENIRCSQQLPPGLQVMINLGFVQDTRLTSVDQKSKYPETSNITSGTEEESPETPESSEIAKTSEKSGASEMITLEYSESSETPEPYEITTSEYPDTSEILESSEMPEEFYISRRPEMPGKSKMSRKSVISGRSDIPRTEMPRKSGIPIRSDMPRSSVMPRRSDTPRCSMVPRRPDVPRNPAVPRGSQIPTCSMIPERSDMPRKSGIPVRSDMPKKSGIPIRSDMPRKSGIPERSDMPRKSGIPVRSDMPGKSSIAIRSDMSRKSDIPVRSDMSRISSIPIRSDMSRKSGIPVRSDMSRKSSIPTRSDMSRKSGIPVRSDMSRKSVTPGRSDMTRTAMSRRSATSGSDVPRKSLISGRSEMTGRSEMAGSSIMTGRSDIPRRSHMPRSSVMVERSDMPRRSDMAQSSVMPERSERWEEQSSASSEEIYYSDSESTVSNTSDKLSDISIHTRQSRVSRVGSILETKVIVEGKTSIKDLRPTITYSEDSKRSILNRILAKWEMEKSRTSEDRSTIQYVDNTVIDWTTVKDPRRRSIKPIEVDSPPRVDSELSRYLGSLLHVVMAGWNSQESKEKIEELLSPKANWSYESLRSEVISLLSETMSDGRIPEQEQERRLKELQEDLQLEESTVHQGESIRFSQFKENIIQEIPKTPKIPKRKRKKESRFTPGPGEIPKTIFAQETPANKHLWVPQDPKIQQDSVQCSLPKLDNASFMQGSMLFKDKRAMRRNESEYTEETQEGSTSGIDDTQRTRKPYVPPFEVTPPIWTQPDFYKNPENRSMLVSTRIEQIQRQQKTLSDIQKAHARQSTISGNVIPLYGHGSMYMRQNMAHPLHSPTPMYERNVKTGHRTPMRILPEDFQGWFINDTELRESVDFEYSTPTLTEDIEYLESDMQWEKAIADQRDSYLEMEAMILGRTDSYTEDEGTESEQTDVHLETEMPVTTRQRTIVVPEVTVSSSQNKSIVAEKISPTRKPTIPESEYNIRMKLLPAFAPRKKTVVQARSKNAPKSSESAQAKSQKINYETIRTTVAEMEREQNRPVTGRKKIVPPKIKSKPATTTGASPKCAQENIDHQQNSGSITREQPRASMDSTKAPLRKSSVGPEITTFRRLSSSISPSRQQSDVVPDESRIRLSTLAPNTSNRASLTMQPGEPRESTLSDIKKHPLEDLGPRFKYSLTPIVEESGSRIYAPSELAVPFDSFTSRRLSTARGSILYPRDSTIQAATGSTRNVGRSVSYLRNPTIQAVPATGSTRNVGRSVSYLRDPTIQAVPATVSTRTIGRSVSYLGDSTIQPVTPKRLRTSYAPKTPCLSSTLANDSCNAPTVLNATIVQKSPFTMKTPKSVQQNATIQKISDRSYEYASPKTAQRNVGCSDFTEKSSSELLLHPVSGKNVLYTTGKINSLLNTAMTENKCSRPKQQHANTTAQYDVEPQQQTTKYSEESIAPTIDSDTNTVNASFYEFISNYHKQSHESITSADEISITEMRNTKRPQPDSQGLNFLRLGVKFSNETIPRQMYADLTKKMPNLEEASSSEIESINKSNMQRFLRNSFELLRMIMKEPPDSIVQPSETQAQSSKTSEQLGTTAAIPSDKYVQKTSTDSANKPAQTTAGVIKKNETLPARRKGSMLPMVNLASTAISPEASLATWIRERRTSHVIPIPALVAQNPESLLPPKKRPIPEWRKDERPYRKLQSLVPNTDKYRVRTNSRRALQNKVTSLRRSKMGRRRRLAVPVSTLNWRKFMRSSTVYANRSRQSMVRSKKFAKQYKKSVADTDKPESIPLMFRQFLIGHIIGEGSFGTVRIAENLFKEEPCAVKMEYISRRKLHLSIENRMYKRLGRAPGFPEIFHFEQFVFDKYNALVMELLGPSLQEIYKKITRFSLKTVIQIINQVLRRIEYIHQKGIIHRDIKPANFLVGRIGTRKQNMIYLVDFGMAKIYKNVRGKHIKYSPAAGRFGTAKYSSINAHFGREHSRRDDLEACGYMFIYFARGNLPWQGLDITNAKQKYQKIGEMKRNIPLEELCEGLPAEFVMYMKYVKRLKFSEEPDYSLLRNMFSELYFRKEYFNRREFDWTELLAKEPDPRLRQGLPIPKHSRPRLQQFYL
ncbi:gilgamesh [Carabus blaptoides fortunei]